MAMPPTNDAVGEVDVADQRVADLVIACPGEDERRNQRAAARCARKLELSASYAGDGAFTAGSASKTVR